MTRNHKLLTVFILGPSLLFTLSSLCSAVSSSITVAATVLENTSFSATSTPVNFNVLVPGKVVFTTPVTVTMASNAYPWTVRIYTDNQSAYTGTGKPAGLVGTTDAKEAVELKAWCANFGPGASYPDVENAAYWSTNWFRIPDKSEMTTDSGTWRQLAYNSSAGDKSLGSSFDVYLAADFTSASAQSYSGSIILEFINPDQGASSSRTVTLSSSATVPESTSFSVSAPSAVLDFGALLPDKIMFKNPITINMSSNTLSWSVRAYTVNSGIYMGTESPAGLVGVGDSRVVLPLKIWCANFGPGTTPPDVHTGNFWQDNWFRIPDYTEMDSDPYSWRRLAYRSPEKNASLGNSFDVYLAADFRSAPAQTYNGNIVFELLNQ